MENDRFESAFDREKALEDNIVALGEKIVALESEVARLKQHAQYEQSDVDELEGKTLKVAFYTLIGKKNEKLDQEYYEADEAKAQYEAAVAELLAARKELNRTEYALRQFRRSQKEEKQAFDALMASVKARFEELSPDVQREFLRLEQELKIHNEQQELILLSIEEGEKALPLIKHVEEAEWEADEYVRRGYTLDEYELRRERQERQKMLSIQSNRFFDAVAKIEIKNKSLLSIRSIRIVLAELNDLLKQRREKQEQIMDRIKKLVGEEESV